MKRHSTLPALPLPMAGGLHRNQHTAKRRPFSDVFCELPLNVTDIQQDRLDLANKTRTNPFPWRGQFSPELIEILLSNYSQSNDFVLDPFAGVGTTLIEAARHGLPAMGVEINPAAVAMAETVLFISKPVSQRRTIMGRARDVLSAAVPETLPLFASTRTASGDPANAILNLVREHEKAPYFRNIFMNTLIRLLEAPPPQDTSAALRAFQQHETVALGLPHSDGEYRVEHCDARSIPLQSRSVDLVITSPPYINVFNYHQNNRRTMEMLGWDLLSVARSEFGSNRKNRGNRFLTVVQYCLDMASSLQELTRLLRPAGRLIIIVGRESNVRGVAFKNGSIVASLGTFSGFNVIARQERKFTSKFGGLIYEDILHLAPSNRAPVDLSTLYDFTRALFEAVLAGPKNEDVSADLRAAIDAAETVRPSPVFSREASYPQ